MILEKLKTLKEERHLSNQQISDLSGVPLSTVTRIFNGQTDNPNIQTITDIVTAMGGSLDELLELEKPNKNEDKLISLYQESIKIKNRYIKFLTILLAVILVILLILVIVDVLCGSIGYVRF